MQTISNVSAVASATVVATADLSAHGKSIVQQLDALSTKRQAWEVTDFKKANEGLYSLLSECLGVFHSQFVNASEEDRKSLRVSLAELLTVKGVRVLKNTNTLTMFVRFVFGSDRKRAHGYPSATRQAMRVLGHSMIGGLALLALPASWDYVHFMRREGTPVLGWSFQWVFMPFVVLMLTLVWRSLWAIAQALRGQGLEESPPAP